MVCFLPDLWCLLAQVYYRVEWAKFQERERKKEEEEKEKERVAYAQIDWHDFVVVETVDFQPSEQGSAAGWCNLSGTAPFGLVATP